MVNAKTLQNALRDPSIPTLQGGVRSIPLLQLYIVICAAVSEQSSHDTKKFLFFLLCRLTHKRLVGGTVSIQLQSQHKQAARVMP